MGGAVETAVRGTPDSDRSMNNARNERLGSITSNSITCAPPKWLSGLVDDAKLNDEAKEKLAFFTRQLHRRVEPDQFCTTNPKYWPWRGNQWCQLRRRPEEHGRTSREYVAMTNESQFEVGRNLAVTPGSGIPERAATA